MKSWSALLRVLLVFFLISNSAGIPTAFASPSLASSARPIFDRQALQLNELFFTLLDSSQKHLLPIARPARSTWTKGVLIYGTLTTALISLFFLPHGAAMHANPFADIHLPFVLGVVHWFSENRSSGAIDPAAVLERYETVLDSTLLLKKIRDAQGQEKEILLTMIADLRLIDNAMTNMSVAQRKYWITWLPYLLTLRGVTLDPSYAWSQVVRYSRQNPQAEAYNRGLTVIMTHTRAPMPVKFRTAVEENERRDYILTASQQILRLMFEGESPLETVLRYSNDYDVIQSVAEIMGHLGDKTAVPALSRAVTEYASIATGRAAMNALVQIGDKEATPALVYALKNWPSSYRAEAAVCLGKIGDKSAIPFLLEASKHPPYDVRYQAARAMEAIRKRYPQTRINGFGKPLPALWIPSGLDHPKIFITLLGILVKGQLLQNRLHRKFAKHRALSVAM